MFFSVIIPIYNRPDEVQELLESLCEQTYPHFEVILAEDGSANKSDKVAEAFASRLNIHYFEKPNSGPGQTRNAGAAFAKGDYLVFFDSDCIIPPHYFEHVIAFLRATPVDAYGGPDRALPTFTLIQKSINYSMTSFFTTGGIRGGKQRMDKFHPRSFNLGVSKSAFNALGGYGKMRFGEDVDFSLRLIEQEFTTALIPEAFVYHKRRATYRQFFKQVHNSGIARINLHLAHPGSLKLVHTLPALFVVFMTMCLLGGCLYPPLWMLPVLYSVVVFVDSWRLNKSLPVAAQSILAAWTQLFGYGTGFIKAVWKRLILKQGEFKAYEKKFYE